MNKNAITKLFDDELARIARNIAMVDGLVPKKVYKLSYSITESVRDDVTGKYVHNTEYYTFIGKLKAFNKESIRFIAMGMQRVKGMRFAWDIRDRGVAKDLETSILYDNIHTIEEWENLDNPRLEAAFIMNYEFVSQDLKEKCFNV